MKHFIFLVIISALLICCGKKNIDKNTFITDRIWRTLDYHQSQYYFSSNDNCKYLWVPSKREGVKYPIAEGNPQTNPFNPSPEGWLKTGTFKIINDTLYMQSLKDLRGDNLSSRVVEIGNDTTFGIVKYNTLRAEYYSIWISEEK